MPRPPSLSFSFRTRDKAPPCSSPHSFCSQFSPPRPALTSAKDNASNRRRPRLPLACRRARACQCPRPLQGRLTSPTLSSSARTLQAVPNQRNISSTAPGDPTEPFLLRIQASGSQPLPRRKRQTTTGTFLEDASSVSPFCQQGAQFRIIQGRLFYRDQFVSVSDPPASKPLLQGGATGAISIGFSFAGGVLSWNNPRFPRLSASFCLLGETVFVYFENRLEGCVDVSLFFASCESRPVWVVLPDLTAHETVEFWQLRV